MVGEGKNKKFHRINWRILCDSKKDGGNGFRDICCFNLCLASKFGALFVFPILYLVESLRQNIFLIAMCWMPLLRVILPSFGKVFVMEGVGQ